MKQTILQFFEWYLPEDQKHWNRLKSQAKLLSDLGFDALWLPPAYKGNGGRSDVGYAVYDMYDLGEFDQKNTTATKYGTSVEYLEAIRTAQKSGLKVYADIVFNHRIGADRTESFKAWPVNTQNRNELMGGLEPIEAWTQFSFDGRNKKYSDFTWNWECFKGTDYNALTKSNGLWLFEGKKWDANVSQELGNYDYVMGDDVDFNNEKVRDELIRWGKWYQGLTGIDGYRIDCVKSIDADYFGGWLDEMDEVRGSSAFAVGEYWSGDVNEVLNYLKQSRDCMHLFDVPLHFRMQQASFADGNYDLRTLFDGTISQIRPDKSVPFVDNHDTQPHQALESWIPAWFKPIAYASILLRNFDSPCVFYGDVYGIPQDQIEPVGSLLEMVWIRNNFLELPLTDFIDEDPQKVCWITSGKHPIAVIMSIGDHKEKEIVSKALAGKTMVSLDGSHSVKFNDQGQGTLLADPGSVCIYLSQEDRDQMKDESRKLREQKSEDPLLDEGLNQIFSNDSFTETEEQKTADHPAAG